MKLVASKFTTLKGFPLKLNMIMDGKIAAHIILLHAGEIKSDIIISIYFLNAQMK
jgi:hypothetical protein